MHIDIENIIKEKSVKIAKYTPKWLFKIVANIIYQDQINDLLDRFGDKKDIDFITSILDYLNISRNAEGADNIAPEKRYIFASNHPLGGVDGFVLAELIDNRSTDIKLVVNDILMNVYPVSGLFTPINKHGKQKNSYALKLNSVLESDSQLLYFPAGLCSRKIDGEIKDTKWNSNFVKKAISHQRDIIPVYVDSVNSTFFYNFALWRKRLGIKVNIEMVLLPSELFKKKNTEVKIIFGTPITTEELLKIKNTDKRVAYVRKRCYALSKTD